MICLYERDRLLYRMKIQSNGIFVGEREGGGLSVKNSFSSKKNCSWHCRATYLP